MGMVSEFKEFAMRGNVIDLAVGVVIGGAFGKIVSALVDQIIMPPIGLLTGGVDFSALKIVLREADPAHKVAEVAIGYDFQIGAGDPNFRSVVLPDHIGDGLYDIWGHDASGQLTELAHDWHGGSVFDFGAAGVDFFRILGIETSAALDPGNATAFVTGVTFTGSGNFTGTQTPITTSVDVAEPSPLALAGLALFALSLARRRRN